MEYHGTESTKSGFQNLDCVIMYVNTVTVISNTTYVKAHELCIHYDLSYLLSVKSLTPR